jgi:hypothetical protein
MSRQHTPDIMGDLMGSNKSHIASEEESCKAIKQSNKKASSTMEGNRGDLEHESNKDIKLFKNKAICDTNNKGIISMKEKATFNLSLSALEDLEDAWIQLKRHFKGEQRVTKTSIVEMALEICISDFKERGEGSLLFKKLNVKPNDDSPT